MTTPVDVGLPPGWLPLGRVPGAVLAAAKVDVDGSAVATMVIALRRVSGLATSDDAATVFAAMPPAGVGVGVREMRWCAPDVVAVLAAHPVAGAPVDVDDLRAAVGQTAVYAVASSGSASSDSSAGVASDACRGSTRTV